MEEASALRVLQALKVRLEPAEDRSSTHVLEGVFSFYAETTITPEVEFVLDVPGFWTSRASWKPNPDLPGWTWPADKLATIDEYWAYHIRAIFTSKHSVLEVTLHGPGAIPEGESMVLPMVSERARMKTAARDAEFGMLDTLIGQIVTPKLTIGGGTYSSKYFDGGIFVYT